MKTANSFIHTSADDCKISLHHTTAADLPILREALDACNTSGQKTKVQYLARRIKHLEKTV